MIWYQINLDYFRQIVAKKNLKESDNEDLFKIISSNLDYVQNLGFDGIWLMPFYVRGEVNKKGVGSPYAVKEFIIDPKFGTEQNLISLINMAHDMGFKIIAEYIPNHLSFDSPFIQENPDVYYADKDGKPLYDQNWSDTVKLKHKNPKVQDFTRDNMKRILTYGFDGFRIDMAHCAFYDIDLKPYFGESDKHFWDKVLEDEAFIDKIFLAEVYSDRDSSYEGYGDYIKLMKNHMFVYDKKILDIVGNKLIYNHDSCLQIDVFRELSFQMEAMKLAGYSDLSFSRFLRIPSNHDDNPGIKNFGGIQEYILGVSILTLMSGDSMIYSGDEYGLSIKPSITGQNIIDNFGNFLETNEIQFVDDTSQKIIYKEICDVIKFKNEYLNNFSELFIPQILDNNHNFSNNLLGYVYKVNEEVYVIIFNFNKEILEWGLINDLFTSLDGNYSQHSFKDFIEGSIGKIFNVIDLTNHKNLGSRTIDHEFWVGVKPLSFQILKLSK